MSAKPADLIRIEDLTIQRGTLTLLDRVSWRVARGEHWVILGPNGCGKTSLLKALNGYLSPSAGALHVLGRDHGAADWREVRPLVGLVSSALQASIPAGEPAIETVISGRYAQLDFWGRPTPDDRKQAKRWLRFSGLTGFEERPWGVLSQGERQRVLIARALMGAPRLLILDEPCSGLDPVAREHFLHVVERLARKRGGPAVVLVTHHVEEITPAFTHALLLRAGAVVAAGPLRACLTQGTLSRTFGTPLKLNRGRDGRLSLRLLRPGQRTGVFDG